VGASSDVKYPRSLFLKALAEATKADTQIARVICIRMAAKLDWPLTCKAEVAEHAIPLLGLLNYI